MVQVSRRRIQDLESVLGVYGVWCKFLGAGFKI